MRSITMLHPLCVTAKPPVSIQLDDGIRCRGFTLRLVLLPLFFAVSCLANDPTQGNKSSENQSRRTWLEVEREVSTAFDNCRDLVTTVAFNRGGMKFAIGGHAGHSIRPSTSVLELVFRRHPHGQPNAAVVILDARIERDYDTSTGKASPFRIVRYVVKDEGHEIIAEVVSFFKKKNWPYEIVDRKKNPAEENGKKDADKKNTGAKVLPVL